MTPVIRKYHGLFVALSPDRKKVVGNGHTPEDALQAARAKGVEEPVLTGIREDNKSCLL